MKEETNKLTNFIIFKDKKRLDMIKEIFIEGNAFSRMTVDQRDREKNKHKITKENIVHVNVLSDTMFIREDK
tara:strand:+ start:508 stop:723 length:216 start_codon:yes stop_codon:yes gene_type:complete